MKQYIVYFGIILGLISCDSYLDIKPENTVVENEVFKDRATTESAIADAYFKTATYTLGTPFLIADLTTNNLDHLDSDYFKRHQLMDWNVEDDFIEKLWLNNYAVINACNVIINKINEFATYNQFYIDLFKGEAKFIRAYSYLKLLQFFGEGALNKKMDQLGVVLNLTNFEGYDKSKIKSRSTNGEIYAQIVKDLTDAIKLLPEKHTNDLANRARANKFSAKALLGRVYLYMHEYKKASDILNDVAGETATYKLSANILETFPANLNGTKFDFGQEVLWGFPIASNGGNFQFGTNQTYYYYKTSYWLSNEFINLYEDGDKRKEDLIWASKDEGKSDPDIKYTTFKYNNNNGRDNVIIIRLAEVLLTKAEALAYDGVNKTSVDLLNQVIKRAKPDATLYKEADFTDKDLLIKRILLERRKELAFEGHYRWDLIRTQGKLKNASLPENKKVYPIPLREINLTDGAIKQNSAYIK